MNSIYTKPKLLFFQYSYDEHLPSFLLTHKQEHVRCLSEFFDVTLIHEDCDYQQICDTYEPDLALFESGVPFSSCRRPIIKNIRACPEVPKLGFLHSDAFSEGRAGFLSDMDHWGIGTFFAIATTAAEHTPEIADNLFIWPNFVDVDVYRDYGQWKNIPVLFTGNSGPLYPWRRKIMKVVSKEYPSLASPHPGYSARKKRRQLIVGESYARMLNASWFVPACGTAAKEVIRKHFEVPACNACLVTERSAAIEAAGFVDMKNCVFADEHDVLDKLDYLFGHPDELNAIIAAGHQLVHSRHTLKHRAQVFQWFTLHKSLKANEKIVQMGPFEPLRIADRSLPAANSHISSDGLFLRLLAEGDEKLWSGRYDEAESLYLRCSSYYRWMPEPLLRIALCGLYKGEAKTSVNRILEPIQFTLAEYKAIDPDPVEWAYFIVSLLCLGKVDEAVERCGQFAWVRHPELDRVRWVTKFLKSRGSAVPSQPDDAHPYRASIHQLPSRKLDEWVRQLCIMLKACGQHDSLDVLARYSGGQTPLFKQKPDRAESEGGTPPKEHGKSLERWPGQRPFAFRKGGAIGYFKRRLFYAKAGTALKEAVRSILHPLEAKYGYFLPYRFSERKNDEFFHAIRALAREEGIKTILIIGAAPQEGCTEALLAGAAENRNKPFVFGIGTSKRSEWSSPTIKSYGLSSTTSDGLLEELQRTVEIIMKENEISCFDLLLIDRSELSNQLRDRDILSRQLCEAKFVLLEDINSSGAWKSYDQLRQDSTFVLVDENPDLRGGYAIFERPSSADCEVNRTSFLKACPAIEWD